MWIARSCWPRVAYAVSALQSVVQKPLVRDLILANKIVRVVKDEPNYGLIYRPVIAWLAPSARLFDPTASAKSAKPNFCIVTVSDASHGSEEVYLDERKEREPFRSQAAKALLLAEGSFADISDPERSAGHVHVVSYGSTVLKRVVNSTIKAETYALTDAQEVGDLIRAAIADMHGQLDPKSWETQSAAFIKHVWFTDCRSVYDTLQKPVAKTVDKRLGIELAALRQFLWRKDG